MSERPAWDDLLKKWPSATHAYRLPLPPYLRHLGDGLFIIPVSDRDDVVIAIVKDLPDGKWHTVDMLPLSVEMGAAIGFLTRLGLLVRSGHLSQTALEASFGVVTLQRGQG